MKTETDRPMEPLVLWATRTASSCYRQRQPMPNGKTSRRRAASPAGQDGLHGLRRGEGV